MGKHACNQLDFLRSFYRSIGILKNCIFCYLSVFNISIFYQDQRLTAVFIENDNALLYTFVKMECIGCPAVTDEIIAL